MEEIQTPQVELNPVQTVADGLTEAETHAALTALVGRFGLRSPKIRTLMRSPLFSAACVAAHRGDWRAADRALSHAHVIE